MNLITESPLWFVIFCLAAGIAYSGILYFRNLKLKEWSVRLIRSIALLRFLAVTFLSFLLLSPLLKTMDREVAKPVIIIAQDVSESIIIGKDAAYYQKEYLENLQKMIDQLNEKYEVNLYSFADKISKINSTDSIKYTGKQTDMSALFEELETRYSNRNVGAIIVASDGLYNKGTSPVYASEKIKVPVYCIAMGDTTIKKDIILLNVEQNRLAYLGNKFPLNIVMNAKQLNGKSTTLTISNENSIVFTQIINFNSDAFVTTIPVLLEAKKVGLQRYKVKLSSLPEENNVSNNTRDIFIDVLDARQKILILSNAPHPDVAAIRESIQANQNYEVEGYLIDDFNKPLKKYDLVILYQVPNINDPAIKLINEIKANHIPTWAFTGATAIFNNDLSIASNSQKTNDSEIESDQNFSLFTITDELRKGIKNFPAVVCPYGNYPSETNSYTLFFQRIGIVATKLPMMTFNNFGENKTAIFYGEGIWKWRLQDFSAHGNHTVFDEFISKTVQYLSVNADKSFFRIISPSIFPENEQIIMEAEVYNESYELINDPEVNVIISNSDNKKFPFTFSKTTNAYRLNAGTMPIGKYSFEAKVKAGGKLYSQRGEFSVVELQVETINNIADHQLLYNIAQKHGGEMVYPNQLDKLIEKLNSREDIKTVVYSQNKLTDLINLKWIFFLLLVLLSLEWFVRKRSGGY